VILLFSVFSICSGDIITVDDDDPADLAIMALHWQQEQ
jgi:hypothetical protein